MKANEQIGRQAVEELLRLMDRNTQGRRSCLDTRLVIRYRGELE